jgi:hypothetical protein
MAWLPNHKIKDEQGNQMTLEALLNFALNKAIENVQSMQNGIYRHTKFPGNTACTQYCPYKRICHKQTAKIINLDDREHEQKK